jgi:hypothetical protein
MQTQIITVLLTLVLMGCAGPFELRKTTWTVAEVQEWYSRYQVNQPPPWNRGITYQGSDKMWHHFIARVQTVDNWAVIKIPRDAIHLEEEFAYTTLSSGGARSYRVDPNRNFTRIVE